MNRFQRRLHLALWLIVGPACLALLWLALHAQSVTEDAFTITPSVTPDAEAAP